MILIVDDDPSVTASLSLLLKRHGHPARGARTPEEALDLLREQDFDLFQEMGGNATDDLRVGIKRDGIEFGNHVTCILQVTVDGLDAKPQSNPAAAFATAGPVGGLRERYLPAVSCATSSVIIRPRIESLSSESGSETDVWPLTAIVNVP